MANCKLSGLQLLLVILLCGLLAAPAFADSQARIVRLSDIEGDVQIDRRDGDGAQQALLNMPVVEGMRLWTGDDGRAEVEFEDGSTLRLVPNSTVTFSRLYLRDNGGRVTNVELGEGTAYFNIDLGKRDDFTIDFGRRTLSLERSARFRVNVDRSEARIAVTQGGVELSASSGVVEVKKNHSATLDLQDTERNEIASAYADEPYDTWDQQQDSYHSKNFRNSQYDVSSPYGYGFSDLNYYGNYVNCAGYGSLWQPYGAGSGWDPFMNGAWMYYPNAGYTWVSAYPWGWLPFRYGSWMYAPSCGGWGWQPGYWTTWYVIPQVIQQPPQWRKPRPPVTGRETVVVTGGTAVRGPVNPVRGGPVTAIGRQEGEAGLGVRRGGWDESKLRVFRGSEQRPAPKVNSQPVLNAAPTGASPQPGAIKPEPGPDVRSPRGMREAGDGPAVVVPRHGGGGRGNGYVPGRTSQPASAPNRPSAPSSPAPAPRPSAPSPAPMEHHSTPSAPAPSPHTSAPHGNSGSPHR
jgi:hypothetical protein